MVNYTDGQTIKFHIPKSSHPFIDPRGTFLRFKVQVKNAHTLPTFSKKCGGHSLINNIRVYTEDGNTQLETIMNYAELAEKLHYYSENSSIRNKRALLELLEPTSRSFDGDDYDNLPARNTPNSQLYNHPYKTGAGTFAVNADYTAEGNVVECCLRLYSGILGEPSTKVFNNILCGLMVEIDLNSAGKVLELWTAEGICNNDGTIADNIGDNNSCRFGICASAGGAGALSSLKLYTEVQAGYTQATFQGNSNPSQASITNGMRLVKNGLCGAVNLRVGQTLFGFKNDGTLTRIGDIASVSCNANENAGGLMATTLTFNNLEAGLTGNDFRGGSGFEGDGTTEGDPENNTCFIKRDDIFGGASPTLNITDVELCVKSVNPPKDYVEKVLKQASTEEGMNVDVITSSVFRNNVEPSEKVAQLNIPALNQRALSVFTLPIANGEAHNQQYNNLDTHTDSANSYQFVINGKYQPTREVDLVPLQNDFTSQVNLWETEKALASSKTIVRNLENNKRNFMFSRALGRYSGVYPLVKDGSLSLKINYDNPVKSKNMVSYIIGIRRFNFSSTGVKVEM